MDAAPLPARLWLIGCGNMGGAMLRRWLAAGIDPAGVTVIDPAAPRVAEGIKVQADFSAIGPAPDTIVLAVKPQQLDAAAAAIRAALPEPPALILSILAGVELATLKRVFATEALVRAMPNLPVSIGKGVVALHGAEHDPGQRARAQALAAPLGAVEWIEDESLFDVVTALSGCGPGFLFRFIEALADAGASLGLPADQAMRLALATVSGAAALAAEAPESPAVLADHVASPGGMTRAGLDVLDEGEALRELLRRTLAAANGRGVELAELARQPA